MGRTSLVLIVALFACGGGTVDTRGGPPGTQEVRSREVVNLRAFARLYGVVRWFHPSDEAVDLDWNAYAVHGVRTVRGAADQAALEAALGELVTPIGPSIRIIHVGDPLPVQPKFPAGGDVVAWQHMGPGFDGGQRGTYESKRTHRTGWVTAGSGGWASFSQALDAAPLRGKKVRLRAQLRGGPGSQARAWLRVDRPAKQVGFFDNMDKRPVVGPRWQDATLEGPVAADAEKVMVGGIVMGDEGWFDGFALEVSGAGGSWAPLKLANPEFDGGIAGWTVGEQGYELTAMPAARDGGPAAVFRAPRAALTADLFDEHPAYGDVSVVDLGDGLRAVVPLALASVDEHTEPRADRAPLDAALAALAAAPATPAEANLADVLVAWNVFAHFYPYFDDITTDWHAYLDDALANAVAAGDDRAAGRVALEQLVVALQDGHGNVITGESTRGLALALALVEGRVMVMASADPAVQRGDEIVRVEGVAAVDVLAAERARHSGSPQWTLAVALRRLGSGPPDGTASLELRRGDRTLPVRARRGPAPPHGSDPPIRELEPGIWLVDLERADAAGIEAKKDVLAGAKGIVFDMRGYPNGTHGVLNHLMDRPEHDRWMHIPHVVKPNLAGQPHDKPVYLSVGWDLEPAAPRWKAKVAFITGGSAISYAESVLGYVEMLKLPVVGGPSAGTNGNIRIVGLPSGAWVIFTGMKVTRHDGSRSHLQGIRPTLPAEPTLAGVAAGRDEVLERAVEVVKGVVEL